MEKPNCFLRNSRNQLDSNVSRFVFSVRLKGLMDGMCSKSFPIPPRPVTFRSSYVVSCPSVNWRKAWVQPNFSKSRSVKSLSLMRSRNLAVLSFGFALSGAAWWCKRHEIDDLVHPLDNLCGRKAILVVDFNFSLGSG